MSALEEAIFECIGEASMAWSEIPKGVFNSDLCMKLKDRIVLEHERAIVEERERVIKICAEYCKKQITGSDYFVLDEMTKACEE